MRLGVWVILCAAIVYFLASIYAVGYMRLIDETERLHRFYALFAGFALSTLVGPMMNNAGLYWIAIELTTLISTFLVAFEHEARASRPRGNTSSSFRPASVSRCSAPSSSTGAAPSFSDRPTT